MKAKPIQGSRYLARPPCCPYAVDPSVGERAGTGAGPTNGPEDVARTNGGPATVCSASPGSMAGGRADLLLDLLRRPFAVPLGHRRVLIEHQQVTGVLRADRLQAEAFRHADTSV